jgi:hypothetical protein
MKTKTWLLSLALLVLGAIATPAQTANFTFGTIESPASQTQCSNATFSDGLAGGICFNFYPSPYSSIVVPFELGFANNGNWQDCPGFAWGAKTWTVGEGTHQGDQYTQPGITSCPAHNGTITVKATFTVNMTRFCSRTGCHNFTSYVLVGGSGTVTEAQ